MLFCQCGNNIKILCPKTKKTAERRSKGTIYLYGNFLKVILNIPFEMFFLFCNPLNIVWNPSLLSPPHKVTLVVSSHFNNISVFSTLIFSDMCLYHTSFPNTISDRCRKSSYLQ